MVHVWRPPPLPLPVADDAKSHEQSQGASAQRQDQHGGGFFDDHSNTFVRPIKEKDINRNYFVNSAVRQDQMEHQQ